MNESKCGNSPPKLGGVPARTAKREFDRAKPKKMSEQAGWFPCPNSTQGNHPALAFARASLLT